MGNNIINGVASEYEMPREPKFYPDENSNIKLPNNLDRSYEYDKICNSCDKEDVCMYKNECQNAIEKIKLALGKTMGISLSAYVKCDKWSERRSQSKELNIIYRGEQ